MSKGLREGFDSIYCCLYHVSVHAGNHLCGCANERRMNECNEMED